MEERENVHAGHRERMMNKFKENPDSFLDHELLEMLLFYAVPRRDTNPLAHRILKRFGSIEKVFSATVDELRAIDGVGEKVAGLIVLTGKIAKNVYEEKKRNRRFFNFAEVKAELKEIFKDAWSEKFAVILLDKNHCKIIEMEFANADMYHVETNISEISKAFAVHKPTFVLVAHNHPSGIVAPSDADDLATKRVKLLCDLHGVGLLDHVICSGDVFFSYHHSGRMDSINNDADINKLLNNIKESENGRE